MQDGLNYPFVDAGELPRPADIDAFIEVYENCQKLEDSATNSTIKDLFGGKTVSTTYGILERLIRFLSGPNNILQKEGLRGIEILFTKEESRFVPTPLCKSLYRELKGLRETCLHLRRRVLDEELKTKIVVSIAAPYTLAMYIIAPALSDWEAAVWAWEHLA